MHLLQRSPKKYAYDVTRNIRPDYKNRVHQKKPTPQKTCGFCTVLTFYFALFYNKCLRCSITIAPPPHLPRHTTSSTKKLHLARTGYVPLLNLEPAEKCCGLQTTSLKSQYWDYLSEQLIESLASQSSAEVHLSYT